RGDVKIKIKRAGEHTVVHSHAEPRFFAVPPAPSTPVEMVAAPPVAPPTAAAPAAPPPGQARPTASPPPLGPFHQPPSPGALPFAKVGDSVEVGQVLCIVEAMKLLNEIESDVAGEILKKLATNGQPIEYGQELFVIRPKK